VLFAEEGFQYRDHRPVAQFHRDTPDQRRILAEHGLIHVDVLLSRFLPREPFHVLLRKPREVIPRKSTASL